MTQWLRKEHSICARVETKEDIANIDRPRIYVHTFVRHENEGDHYILILKDGESVTNLKQRILVRFPDESVRLWHCKEATSHIQRQETTYVIEDSDLPWKAKYAHHHVAVEIFKSSPSKELKINTN